MEKNIKKVFLYVYNWVTLLYIRDWHNFINQLYFSFKKIFKKKQIFEWVVQNTLKLGEGEEFF